MSDIVWSDPDWLQYYPLNAQNALDYFARSSFYDFNCNNELIRQKGLDLSMLAAMPPGIQYTIHDSQEPHLYVIHKQMRDSPTKTTSLKFYYILDGKVYQAPPLHAAISSRMSRCLFQLKAAFKRIQEDIDPLHSISIEGEVQKSEEVMKQNNKQVRRTQEDKERDRQIDGILHSVVQSHAKLLPALEGEDILKASRAAIELQSSEGKEGEASVSAKETDASVKRARTN